VPGLRGQQGPIRVLYDPKRCAVRLLQELPAGDLAPGARRRRNAALRALIALHPEEWRAALQHDPDEGESVGGGSDVA
jgi:hypothetical protein